MIEEATPDTNIIIRLGYFDEMRSRLLAAEARVKELEAERKRTQNLITQAIEDIEAQHDHEGCFCYGNAALGSLREALGGNDD